MKVLITSDIHLHDFRSHQLNGDPFFRLHQFDTLADRLVDIIQAESVEAVCIAGDFLHVASPRPFIVNAAARFLKKIADYCPIYATHGQHDYDSRTNMSSENSLLSVYNYIPNVRYLDHASVDLGERSFYFQGWTPTQDFSNIASNEFDILIGHATVDDAVINDYGTKLPGQTYQNDKFKLCFMGDVHRHQVKGNQIIPGVPVQNNHGDASNTGVIILDTTDLSWKRVPIDGGKQKFLKFRTSVEVSEDPYVISKLPPGHEGASKKENLTKSLDINEIMQKSVDKEGLGDLHTTVVASTDRFETDSLDLNFFYERIVIRNFRSIEFLEWTPETGISIINGLNGTGKSSLVEAIRFGEEGHPKPKEFVRTATSLMSVDISRKYGDVSYRTVRGCNNDKGFTQYFIDDQEVQSENQPALRARIENDLPYIKMYDMLHHSQDRPRFLSSYNYASRVDLISRVIGLSIVERLKKTAEQLRSGSDTQITSLNNEANSIKMFLTSTAELDFSDLNTDYDELILQSSNSLKDLLSIVIKEKEYEKQKSQFNALTMAHQQYTSMDFTPIETFDEKAFDSKVKSLAGERDSTDTEAKQHREKREKFLKTLTDNQTAISINNARLSALQTRETKLTLKKCYACDQDIGADKHKSMQSDISREQQAYQLENENLSKSNPGLTLMISKFDASLDDFRQKSSDKSNEIADLTYQKRQINDLRTQYEQYSKLKAELRNVTLGVTAVHNELTTLRVGLSKKHSLDLMTPAATELQVNNLRAEITRQTEKKSSQQKLKNFADEIKLKKARMDTLSAEISSLYTNKARWDRYVQMMSPNGVVTRSVLTTLSDQLSGDSIRVIAFKTLANGETRPDFTLQMKVPEIGWINYDTLSGGQRTVCDIFILYHLIAIAGGAGILVLDETLGQLDTENLEFCVNALKAMQVNNTIIVSHHENFPYSDQTIIAKLENGVTKYTFN